MPFAAGALVGGLATWGVARGAAAVLQGAGNVEPWAAAGEIVVLAAVTVLAAGKPLRAQGLRPRRQPLPPRGHCPCLLERA